jgi:hypothetical protein
MSLKSTIAKILGVAVPALLAWGRTEAERALAALKNSPTGAQIVRLVHDAEATDKAGPEKMATVLADAAPLVLALVTKGGVQAEVAAVETLARAVIESVVADLKGGSVAAAVLAALGAR